jgi:endonuclease YncB( thermonuclease family)
VVSDHGEHLSLDQIVSHDYEAGLRKGIKGMQKVVDGKRYVKEILILYAVLSSGVFLTWLWPGPKKADLPNIWPVLRVIDGNTIVIRYFDQIEQIRLLGVNAPARGRPGYEQAREALKVLIEGYKIFLEFEPSQRGKRDRNGRLPGYVFHDGSNINIELVRSGWSKYRAEYDGGQYAHRFQDAEREAQISGTGLWALASCLNSQ